MRELRFICIEDDLLFMHKMIDSIKAYFQREEFEVVFETYQDIPKYLNLKSFLNIKIMSLKLFICRFSIIFVNQNSMKK